MRYALLLLPFVPAFAGDYYVATTGSSGNAGTVAAPWTLACLIAKTCTGFPSLPATEPHRFWFRGGDYGDVQFNCSHAGTSANRLKFAAYPGETPQITLTSLSGGPGVGLYSIEALSTCTYSDFERFLLVNTITQRSELTSTINDYRSGGVANRGDKNRFIDIRIFNTGAGVDVWTTNPALGTSDYLFNYVAYNGEQKTDGGHNHGMYMQNQGALQVIYGMTILQPFSQCLNIYGSATPKIENFWLESNACVLAGEIQDDVPIPSQGFKNFFFGSNRGAYNVTVKNNSAYSPLVARRENMIGYGTGGTTRLTMTGNVFHADKAINTDVIVTGLGPVGLDSSGNKFWGDLDGPAGGVSHGTHSIVPGSPLLLNFASPDPWIAYDSLCPTCFFRGTISGGTGASSGANGTWDIVPVGEFNANRVIATATAGNPTTFTYTGDVPYWIGGTDEYVRFSGMAGGTWSGLNTGAYKIISSTNTSNGSVVVDVNTTGFGSYTASSGQMNDMATVKLKATGGGAEFNCPSCTAGTLTMAVTQLPIGTDVHAATPPTTGQDILYAPSGTPPAESLSATLSGEQYGTPGICKVDVWTYAAATSSVVLACASMGFANGDPVSVYDGQYPTGSALMSGTCATGGTITVTLPTSASAVLPMVDGRVEIGGLIPTPPVHTPKLFNTLRVERTQTYRSVTQIGFPFITSSATALVEYGYMASGTVMYNGPKQVVTCASPTACTATIPQSIGDAYYRITYRNGGGSTLSQTAPQKARAN